MLFVLLAPVLGVLENYLIPLPFYDWENLEYVSGGYA